MISPLKLLGHVFLFLIFFCTCFLYQNFIERLWHRYGPLRVVSGRVGAVMV